MDKAEGRRLLKGIQAIVNQRGDEEAGDVLAEAAAFCAENAQPKKARKGKGGTTREEKAGLDRSEG